MNNKYKIVAEAPLIRAGLSISTEVSSGYVREAVKEMIGHIRDINDEQCADVNSYKEVSEILHSINNMNNHNI